VKDMITAIQSDSNIIEYLLSFKPDENTGYSWTQDTKYKKYSDILDIKTGQVHSAASFACCLREAVDHIHKKREPVIIIAEVSNDTESNDIITLDIID